MLDSLAVSDLPLHTDIVLKDALAQRSSPEKQQPGAKALATNSRSSFAAGLLNLRRLSSVFKQPPSGFDNLPPHSSQDRVTPCSSSETSLEPAAAAIAQLQHQRSGPDVCDRELDVSSAQNCSGGGGGGGGAATTTSSRIAVCDGGRPGTTSSSSSSSPVAASPAAAQQTAQQPQTRGLSSIVMSFCAAQAKRLKTMSKQAVATTGASSTAAQQPQQQPSDMPLGTPHLKLFPAKCRKALCRQQAPSLPPLSLNNRQPVHPKRQRRAASVFEATGRENIRMLLGPHAIWGSVTRYKMLMLAEQVHENHLQAVLNQSIEQADWAGEPAWEDDFSVISTKYGQRVRQCLFWWGGALAHHKWRDSEGAECGDDAEEAAAQVAVVVGGPDDAAEAASTSKKL